MNRSKFLQVLLVIVYLLIFSEYTLGASIITGKGSKPIVLVDAGHGGIDGGAVGTGGVLEKDINLVIAKKLKNSLIKAGYNVIMTREEDIGLYTESGTIRKKKLEDLNNRQKLIKDLNCQLFISIHLNTFPEKKYYGAQVWYADNKESSKVAQLMQQNLREDLDKDNKRAAKAAKDGYIILRNPTDIPAIIVECGFMSNPNEASKLKDEIYQQRIADSITRTVSFYLKD